MTSAETLLADRVRQLEAEAAFYRERCKTLERMIADLYKMSMDTERVS